MYFCAQPWLVHVPELNPISKEKSLQLLRNLILIQDLGKDHNMDLGFPWMAISNQFHHLWYQWTLLPAFHLQVNVAFQQYMAYRYIRDRVVGILTALIKEVISLTSLQPRPQVPRHYTTQNTPMGGILSNNLVCPAKSIQELSYLKNHWCKWKKKRQFKVF